MQDRLPMKVIKVTTDNKLYVLESDLQYDSICKELNCCFFEVVKTPELYDFFGNDAAMLVDDNGHSRNLDWNRAGSMLYGYRRHFQHIVGDVIFCLRDGPEIFGFGSALDYAVGKLVSVYRLDYVKS